jgi:uncharacterized protein YlxW (UPF0749 family)
LSQDEIDALLADDFDNKRKEEDNHSNKRAISPDEIIRDLQERVTELEDKIQIMEDNINSFNDKIVEIHRAIMGDF